MQNGTGEYKPKNLKLIILYKLKKIPLKVDVKSTTLGMLQGMIQEATEVPPALQQIIFKGNTLKEADSLLYDLGIHKTKTKLTVIGCTTADIAQSLLKAKKKSSSSMTDDDEEVVEKEKTISERKPHVAIIDKGLPPDHIEGEDGKNQPLPHVIKGIINSEGEPVRLIFKNDLQQLWISTATSTNKVNYMMIRSIKTEPIHANKHYSMVGLQLGNESDDHMWFYWVPNQFTRSFRYTLLGNTSFPFLQS